MIYKTLAIFTLTALAFGELTGQAIASPAVDTTTPNTGVRNHVISVEASPATLSTAVSTPTAVVVEEPGFVQSKVAQPQSVKINSEDLTVTATDVRVVGAGEELQQIILSAVSTRPGGSTSQSQLDKDVEAILNTGLFADARVTSNSNQDGLEVVYQVEPVVLRSIQLLGNQVLSPEIAQGLFNSQLGKPVNPAALNQAVQQLNQWYTDNGYVLAQVADMQTTPNGEVAIEVAEGIIGDINFRFLDPEAEPTQGRTREDFLKRELKLQSGEAFRVDVARQDLKQMYQLGLFDKVDISLNGDAREVDVTYDLTERLARGVNASAGYNNDTGIFGTISYDDQNLGGVNQKLGLNLQISRRDLQFETNYGNPYRASDPDRPGYNVNAFRRGSISRTFDGDIELANGDRPRERQFGGGLTLTKPLNEWDTSVGVNYTRTSIRDSDGNLAPVDELGNRLSFSDNGIDDLVTLSAAVTRDQRDNRLNPTQGSLLSFSTQQSVPVGSGNILMNRLQANYSQYTPLNLFGGSQPEVLAVNLQGGTTIGDLPPYQAFNLGGLNSVRGYGSGEVGSGRSYVLASAEYRIPVFKPVGAVLFADFASDLGSGDTVPGEPGVVRGKPGVGFGYGAGLRVNSPIGVIRADYGFNDQGDSQLQFGIGQKF
ncbi:BamA/TamA family outer membrane protein [Lyngbya aestuarii]|uniref:BamA/TamA family outer membrane protein n=1 Tax=Lyngbya aestuarii TaxID=118322 RepID=UPI00403DA6B3